jgi:hypothetical protein
MMTTQLLSLIFVVALLAALLRAALVGGQRGRITGVSGFSFVRFGGLGQANQSAHGDEGLSLSKARIEPQHSFETRLRQAQPLLRVSGPDYTLSALI